MTTTIITALPCGKDRHGNPLQPRTYVVDHRREDWGDGRTRVFVRRPDLDARPGQQCFAPELVRTDSIIETEPGRLVQCSNPMCPARATLQSYSDRYDPADPWAAAGFIAFCAAHAPSGAWSLQAVVGMTAPEVAAAEAVAVLRHIADLIEDGGLPKPLNVTFIGQPNVLVSNPDDLADWAGALDVCAPAWQGNPDGSMRTVFAAGTFDDTPFTLSCVVLPLEVSA